MTGRTRSFIEPIIESDWGFMIFLLIIAAIFSNQPFQEFPDAMSMTTFHASEMNPQTTLSFVTDAKAARIVHPFHWDLKNDAVIGRKRVFSARMYPEYEERLRKTQYVIAEGYHSPGNWSTHKFIRAPGSTWNVYVTDIKNEHIDAGIELNGTIEASHMLFWTTVKETEVEVPSSLRGEWILRNKETGFRGGYRQYKLLAPLSGKISFGVNPPRGALRWMPREELIKMFKYKVESSNIIMGDSGKFYTTDVYGSIETAVDKLLGRDKSN